MKKQIYENKASLKIRSDTTSKYISPIDTNKSKVCLKCCLRRQHQLQLCALQCCHSRWAGWAFAHPEFGVSVDPIYSNQRGADYARRITARPPGFETLTTSLYNIYNNIMCKRCVVVQEVGGLGGFSPPSFWPYS